MVRLPFRWERLQPQLGQPLDPSELLRLQTAVAQAGAAGLKVVLDVHNYGAYYLSDGRQGVRRALGSDQVTKAHFADLWSRVSAAFAGNPAVMGYGLMNEPIGIGSSVGLTPARRWEIFSQAAVDAIRARGDATTILVSGYFWSGAATWKANHPKAWIVDPLGRFRYEAHHYFDRDHSGHYRTRYAQELAPS
jgi:aryl-phospho-beta-D-glucosidase BglC (GH1 family)